MGSIFRLHPGDTIIINGVAYPYKTVDEAVRGKVGYLPDPEPKAEKRPRKKRASKNENEK